ncbi:MAG: hypothetical protein J6R81_03585 [Alistipes sp.]|nr:hypothetical protein [Alistipes sp.]
MTNKVHQPENDIMVETKGKLELFFDKYGNKLLTGLGCITVIAIGFFLVSSIAENRNAKREAMADAALAVALNGEGVAEEFVAVVEEYGKTKAGNTAAYLAGAAYLEAGDMENAKLYLEKYNNAKGVAGEIINALVLMLRGDLAVEQNDLQSAEALYLESMACSNDPVTYTEGAQKLALVYAAMGDEAKAEQCYKDIVAKYPEQARAYSKYISK